MKTLAAEWYEFERKTIAPDVPDLQRNALKISFYAGAIAVLTMQMMFVDKKIGAKEAAKAMQCWYAEARLFADGLKKGRKKL